MDTVKLRKFEDTDIALFKDWLYRPHVSQWYHEPLDWLEEVEKRHDDFCWLHHYIVELEGIPIGFCQYYEYCAGGETWHGDIRITGTYSIDYMIGEKDYLKKGIGKAIIKALIHKISAISDAERIIVQPEAENIPSGKALLSCGFDFDEANEVYIIRL